MAMADSGSPEAGEKEGTSTQLHSEHDRKSIFQRFLNLSGVINFLLIAESAWVGIALTFQISLVNGGPAALVYGSIFATVGSMAIVASLAEMASMDPAVGAQYRWSAAFAPRYPEFWGLIQGWITVLAWVAVVATTSIVLSNVVIALIIFNNESYERKSWHTTLLMWAFIIAPLVWNFYFRNLINTIETIAGVSLIIFFIVTVGVLAALAQKSTSEFVFKTLVHDVSGWTNPAVCWGIGVLTTTGSLIAYDGVVHMSDETKRPRTGIPRSMVVANIINAITMFAFVICLMYTLGDLNQVTTTPTQLPILVVYYQATKNKHATNFLVFMLIFPVFIGLFNAMAGVSRLIWCFATDKGLPFSNFFARVNLRLGVPVNALLLVAIISMLLAIIPVGSTTAFFALISLVTVAFLISYTIPILFILIRKLRGRHPQYGPFRLGRWGIPINLFALVYILFVVSFVVLPPFRPVTAVNMNYAGPLVLAVIALAVVDWMISGHRRFKVPVPPALADE